jgi:large subunit ribosomal protein L20
MPRATNAPASRGRRKAVLKRAKGFRGARSKLFKTAHNAVWRAEQFAYRDRRTRKRDFRRLWISRINAAARMNGMSYSRLMDGLRKANVTINRKMLADLAVQDIASFAELVEIAKSHATVQA